MKEYGKLNWAFSAGRIPFATNGEEPAMTSHDKISVLNLSEEEAVLKIAIFYEDEPPKFYEVKLRPSRLKKIRFNDLIDPEAIRMERNFSCYVESNVPVVIQHSRMNTGSADLAEMSTMAFPVDDQND